MRNLKLINEVGLCFGVANAEVFIFLIIPWSHIQKPLVLEGLYLKMYLKY